MKTEQISRRGFLQCAGMVAGLGGVAADQGPGDRSVALVYDPADRVAAAAPAQWALQELRQALVARGFDVQVVQQLADARPGERCILSAGAETPQARALCNRFSAAVPPGPETLGLLATRQENRPVMLACGGDARGLMYALLELADRVGHADEPLAGLHFPLPVVERPANPVRSVARLFVSDVEDKGWFQDRSFWPPYLSMLAAQRFNRFSLTLGLGYDFTRQIRDAYLHFAYPFLVEVPGYSVRAVPLPDQERARNLAMLRFISDETARRGLDFQLGLWTHAYQWIDSPQANYTIQGLTAASHAAYCRDALRTLLEACPAISGVTFRIHGESGVPEGSRDFWRTVFDGVARSGRRVTIDLHAKGLDQATLDAALATGMPVTVSPKFWAEHMGLPYHQASIRSLEQPPRGQADRGFFAQSNGSRRFLRYGYGDLLTVNRRHGVYYRIWPGTQRLLLWGDPAMAAAYGRAGSFGGGLGVELCEPLSFKGRKGSGLPGSRSAYRDEQLRPAADWQKYLYTYRLWGRLLYNPEADPQTWRRLLTRQFGGGAAAAEAALASASRILPLVTTAHMPSAANNNYWPEMYTNLSLLDGRERHPYGDTPVPRRFGTVSSLDPVLFSRIEDHVDELLAGRPSGKYSPLDVAHWLLELADAASGHLSEATRRTGEPGRPEWRRLADDVAIQCGLGRFFAFKLRAGVLYALYERGRDRAALQEALRAYRAARNAWAQLVSRGSSYGSDITFGPEAHQRGHWRDRLPAIDRDLERLDRLREQAPAAPSGDRERLRQVLQQVLNTLARLVLVCRHQPPPSLRPGQPVSLMLSVGPVEPQSRPAAVTLHYRHVNQAEDYRTVAMQLREDRWEASIPGAYLRSPYALQYFFELRDTRGRAGLYPGFEPNLCNQPYFLVRQR
jgi:hypothetical protein